MKTKEIFTVALSIIALTSCIKEDYDCPKNDIEATAEITANATLNINIEEENSYSTVSEIAIDNMVVLVFNNNKKLVKHISIQQETIAERNKKGNYQLAIPSTTGYHFFYVVANMPEDTDFETGDHFNDIVGNIIYRSEDIFITAESPRILLKEGENTVNIHLIRQ